jgi:membrane fusion protein, multidrug efflux system
MKQISLLLVSAMLILQSCSQGSENNTTDGASPDSTSSGESKKLPDTRMQVSVIAVQPESFEHYIEVQGAIEAEKNVILTAETGGLIRNIVVQEGQRVSAGQTLVILDSDLITKNISEVQKSLELANYVYEKQSSLHSQGIGSELQFQQAKNNKERLEQSLETLKSQQSMAVVTAPFDGYVEEIFPNVGEMAAPQVPLIRLLNLKRIRIVADVMENYLRSVTKNKKIDLYFSALDTVIRNIPIGLVGKYINPANRTFKIQAEIDNTDERLLPNMVAVVRVKNEVIDSALVVPSISIQQSSSGENYLYVTKEHFDQNKIFSRKKTKVEKRNVKVGPSDDTKTVILEGVRAGDEVIVDGARGVKPGMSVRIKK